MVVLRKEAEEGGVHGWSVAQGLTGSAAFMADSHRRQEVDELLGVEENGRKRRVRGAARAMAGQPAWHRGKEEASSNGANRATHGFGR